MGILELKKKVPSIASKLSERDQKKVKPAKKIEGKVK